MSDKALRDKIRAATVGAKKQFQSKIVECNGVEIEVRQVGLSDRREYVQSAIDQKTKEVDILKLQINAIIMSCYVPGTDIKLYDGPDYDSIAGSVTAGYADKLWEVIQELSNFSIDDAKKN